MTSPTDLAERLRAIQRGIESGMIGYGEAEPDDNPLPFEEAAAALDRLSALESAASGAVTDADAAALAGFIESWTYEDGRCWADYRECKPENVLAVDGAIPLSVLKAALVAVLGPRLAKAEQRCNELEALLAAPDSRYQVVAPEGAWVQAACPGDGGTGHIALVYVSSGSPLPTWPGFLCNEHRAPSSEPAPSDGDSPPGLTTPTFVESGAYVDPWDALTPEQRETYLRRALTDEGVTGSAAFLVAQRMARDDAKKGQQE